MDESVQRVLRPSIVKEIVIGERWLATSSNGNVDFTIVALKLQHDDGATCNNKGVRNEALTREEEDNRTVGSSSSIQEKLVILLIGHQKFALIVPRVVRHAGR